MLSTFSVISQKTQNMANPVFAKDNYRIENFRISQSKQLNALMQTVQQANKVNATEQINKSATKGANNAIISNRHTHEYVALLAQKIKFRNQQTNIVAKKMQVSELQPNSLRVNSSNENKLSAYRTFINNNRLKSLATVSHQLDSVLVHSKEYQSDTQEFIGSDFRVEYTYNQAHFNNLLTVKIKKSDNTFENHFKYEYSLDDNGHINSESYYEWSENKWLGVEKQQVQFDANAYPVAIIWYVWDAANSIWVEDERLETTYDSEYNPVLDINSLWNFTDSRWVPLHKAEYSYTNELGITKQVFSNYNTETQEWVIYQFAEDKYDATMQILSRIMYTESFGFKSEFEYDINLNLTASRDYDLDIATGTWNMTAEIISVYNAYKKMLSFKSKFYWGNYETPANGEIKEYVPYRKEEITRNDSVSSVVSYWDSVENKWLESSMGIYHMNKDGNIIRYTELLRDAAALAWVNTSKNEYLLDDKANIIEESNSYWITNTIGMLQSANGKW